MLRLFEKKKCAATLADYYKSGDLNGDYSTSVSYASIVFSAAAPPPRKEAPIGLDRDEQKLLLELARATLRVLSCRTAGSRRGRGSALRRQPRLAGEPGRVRHPEEKRRTARLHRQHRRRASPSTAA